MSKAFWKATLIRAIRTVCQTAVATIGTAAVITDVNWQMVVSASLLAGLLSVLTSIATGLPEVDALEVVDSMHDAPEPDEIEDAFFEESEEE